MNASALWDIEADYMEIFKPGLLIKIHEKRSLQLHEESLNPVWASRAENEKISSRTEKVIDRRGEMQFAKTAKAIRKFQLWFTSDFSFTPGLSSCNRDFFHPCLQC